MRMLFISNQKAYVSNIKDLSSLFTVFKNTKKDLEIVICSSAAHISVMANLVKSARKKNIHVGAQNFSLNGLGAHTGDIATVEQLRDFKTQYCILGHSEVRAKGETASQVKNKIELCLRNKITPIVCIGELKRDDKGTFLRIIEGEVKEIFKGFSKRDLENMVICYEPVWAINTGKRAQVCTPAHFEESVRYIKKVLHDMTGNMPIGKLTFIYGGSVNAETVKPFFASSLCDGFLVGSASTDVKNLKALLGKF